MGGIKEVVITDWALDSYLDLKHKQTFTDDEYRDTLRPDAMLLHHYPSEPKFNNRKFWGPAKAANGAIRDGYKMKWHNIGNGTVQLRLLVVILDSVAYLCNAYEKDGPGTDKRQMAKLKDKIQKIEQGTFVAKGKLT
jgi:hypothetical protein